ncbi:MAG: hypothetical protein U1E70_10310 [Acetobacteraceae bacterium]
MITATAAVTIADSHSLRQAINERRHDRRRGMVPTGPLPLRSIYAGKHPEFPAGERE